MNLILIILQSLLYSNVINWVTETMLLPVSTLSPICNSDILTSLPFSRTTLAVDGKQPPPPSSADGGVEGTRK